MATRRSVIAMNALFLKIELPDKAVAAYARILVDRVPEFVEWLEHAIADGFRTRTSHACFDGHEVFCLLPGERVIPLKNRTTHAHPGDVLFFQARSDEYAFLAQTRLSGGSQLVNEIAFCYGDVDLRHFCDQGMIGSLIGRIEEGLEPFALACSRTLNEGATSLLLTLERSSSRRK
jgi:Protein of unknown function (DUF3830)